MRLSEFNKDCLERTGDQIREGTKTDCRATMKQFIKLIGDIDFRSVDHRHGEQFRQARLDAGNTPHTVAKKIRELKSMFELAVKRKQLCDFPDGLIDSPKIKHL